MKSNKAFFRRGVGSANLSGDDRDSKQLWT